MTALTSRIPAPVRRLARYLTRLQLRAGGVFWAILVLGWGSSTFIIGGFSTLGPGVWTVMGQAAPKWYLFVMGIAIVAMGLPVYVAHGITRRHTFLAAGIVLGLASLVFAVLGLAMFVVEGAVLHSIRPTLSPALVSSIAAGWLTHALWAACGWMAGAGFYRLGPWLGTAFLVPAAAPLVIGESAVRAGDAYGLGDSGLGGLGGLAATPTGLLAVAAAALAVLAAYLLVRHVPIRKVSG